MTVRRRTRRSLEEVRRLGARLTFVEHEWLPSMFRRIGHAFDTSAEDITNWCGLYDIGAQRRSRLGNKLMKRAIQGIEAGLGFTGAQLQTTVMGNLSSPFVSLRDDGSPIQSKDWSRGSGTRFCVECLRERPGVFYKHWRTWWCFLCPRHGTVLRAGCPSCHREIVEASLQEREARDPGLCWSTLPTGGFCQHPLVDAWDEPPAPATSPMLQAQLALASEWTNKWPFREEATLPTTLRGAGIALLGAGDLGRIAELAEIRVDALHGLFDQGERTGGTPPREPLAMAALTAAAFRLVTAPEPDVHRAIRATAFSRPVRSAEAVEGPGSAQYLLSFWPGIGERMRARVLRALDSDLPPIQRLVLGSAASATAYETFMAKLGQRPDRWDVYHAALDTQLKNPSREANGRWSQRLVPRLMWPSWATPLGINPRTEPVALQMALADALRIAGTGEQRGTEAIAGIGRKLRPALLGDQAQTDAILRQLCELALVLRADGGPIDYERRLGIPPDQLLSEEHWHAIADSVGETPGKHRRWRNARRYAFLRMSAAAPSDLPETLRFGLYKSDVPEYTDFIVTMTAEMKIAIDDYLTAWLQKYEHHSTRGMPRPAGARIVVADEPTRFRFAGAQLAPELDDIDLPIIHELLADGEVRLGVLAEAVDRTPRHVRWAIAAHPLPSGRLVSKIDWAAEFAKLPDGNQNQKPEATEPPPVVFDFKTWDL